MPRHYAFRLIFGQHLPILFTVTATPGPAADIYGFRLSGGSFDARDARARAQITIYFIYLSRFKSIW